MPGKIQKLIGVTVGVIAISVIAKNLVVSGQQVTPGAEPTQVLGSSSDQPTEEPFAEKRQVDTSQLKDQLAAIIKQYPYNTSVSVISLNDDTLVQTGDSYPFIAASTTKLLTVITYLDGVQAGKYKLDETIDGKPASQLLQLAINKSDNDALASLNNFIKKETVAEYAKQKGVASYDPAKNTITSNDMALFMAKLYNKELLNAQYTNMLLEWMHDTSEERFIPAAVPEGMKVFHKAGYLAERVHDASVIDNGSAPFVLVIYSKTLGNAAYDYGVGQKLFKQITEQVITTFK